jgi:hypothetical protein
MATSGTVISDDASWLDVPSWDLEHVDGDWSNISPTSATSNLSDDDAFAFWVRSGVLPPGYAFSILTDTNSTVSGIPGPGRLVGELLWGAGRRLEPALDRVAAQVISFIDKSVRRRTRPPQQERGKRGSGNESLLARSVSPQTPALPWPSSIPVTRTLSLSTDTTEEVSLLDSDSVHEGLSKLLEKYEVSLYTRSDRITAHCTPMQERLEDLLTPSPKSITPHPAQEHLPQPRNKNVKGILKNPTSSVLPTSPTVAMKTRDVTIVSSPPTPRFGGARVMSQTTVTTRVDSNETIDAVLASVRKVSLLLDRCEVSIRLHLMSASS